LSRRHGVPVDGEPIVDLCERELDRVRVVDRRHHVQGRAAERDVAEGRALVSHGGLLEPALGHLEPRAGRGGEHEDEWQASRRAGHGEAPKVLTSKPAWIREKSGGAGRAWVRTATYQSVGEQRPARRSEW